MYFRPRVRRLLMRFLPEKILFCFGFLFFFFFCFSFSIWPCYRTTQVSFCKTPQAKKMPARGMWRSAHQANLLISLLWGLVWHFCSFFPPFSDKSNDTNTTPPLDWDGGAEQLLTLLAWTTTTTTTIIVKKKNKIENSKWEYLLRTIGVWAAFFINCVHQSESHASI